MNHLKNNMHFSSILRFYCQVQWLLLMFAFTSPLLAQPSFQLNGYAKNLAIRSKSILEDKTYLLNISRLRTKGILDFGTKVHSEIWLDSEILAGNYLSTLDFALSKSIERPTFANLDWTISDGDNHQLKQSLFRVFTTLYAGNAEIKVGRQRIAWGTGFVWNPTDLLNPYNPAAIELEEKTGVDAIYGVLPFGSLSRIEAAYAPGRGALKASTAARITTNWRDYDFSIMAGDFQDSFVVGGDFAGYIGGGGFRGEFAYTQQDGAGNFLRAVVNADYNFPGDWYAFVEFYFNGQGESNKNDYNLTDLFSGNVFNLAQHYLAFSVTKSITPLFTFSAYNINNLNDHSVLFGPVLTYSLAENLELSLSSYLFIGANDTEYGQLKSSYFGSMQYYF